MKPFRSMLFAPANDAKKVAKVLGSEADAVILDLEDAVPVSEKESARLSIFAALAQPRSTKCYVRVNSLGSGFLEADLRKVVYRDLDGIMLPKSETAQDIRQVESMLAQLERKRSIPEGSIDLLPLVESAKGVYAAYEIAKAGRRVKRLAFGGIDFTLDINTGWTKEGTEILYARSHLVVASRAAEIDPPIDTVYIDVKDLEGLAADCRKSRQLGFQGRLVIHPQQVAVVHEAFSPTGQEVSFARKVVEAFAEAEARGIAAISVDGKMIDYPVVARAKKVLSIAEAISGGQAG